MNENDNDNDNEKYFTLTLTMLINDLKYETENKRMWLITWRPYRTII